MDIITPIILFSVGGMMMLFAYLIGVRKMYNLISGINMATAKQKAIIVRKRAPLILRKLTKKTGALTKAVCLYTMSLLSELPEISVRRKR